MTPDDKETRKVQFRLFAEEAKWKERWDAEAPAPTHSIDLRPTVYAMDQALLYAAQILSLGPGVVSPATVQIVENALCLFHADEALDNDETTAEEYDKAVHWLLDGAVEPREQ